MNTGNISGNFYLSDFNNDIQSQTYVKNQISDIPLLSEEEELALFNDYWDNRDEKARQKIISSHLHLVFGMAVFYSKISHISFVDFMNEGVLGMMKALETYDISKPDVRFCAYAKTAVRLSMWEHVLKNTKIVSFPAHMGRFFNKARQKSTDNDSVSMDELADFIGDEKTISLETAAQVYNAFFTNPAMGDSKTYEDEMMSLCDGLPDCLDNIINEEEKERKIEMIREALEALPPRERFVFRARRLSDDPAEIAELAACMKLKDVSKVSEIAKNAEKKVLAHMLASNSNFRVVKTLPRNRVRGKSRAKEKVAPELGDLHHKFMDEVKAHEIIPPTIVAEVKPFFMDAVGKLETEPKELLNKRSQMEIKPDGRIVSCFTDVGLGRAMGVTATTVVRWSEKAENDIRNFLEEKLPQGSPVREYLDDIRKLYYSVVHHNDNAPVSVDVTACRQAVKPDSASLVPV